MSSCSRKKLPLLNLGFGAHFLAFTMGSRGSTHSPGHPDILNVPGMATHGSNPPASISASSAAVCCGAAVGGPLKPSKTGWGRARCSAGRAAAPFAYTAVLSSAPAACGALFARRGQLAGGCLFDAGGRAQSREQTLPGGVPGAAGPCSAGRSAPAPSARSPSAAGRTAPGCCWPGPPGPGLGAGPPAGRQSGRRRQHLKWCPKRLWSSKIPVTPSHALLHKVTSSHTPRHAQSRTVTHSHTEPCPVIS